MYSSPDKAEAMALIKSNGPVPPAGSGGAEWKWWNGETQKWEKQRIEVVCPARTEAGACVSGGGCGSGSGSGGGW